MKGFRSTTSRKIPLSRSTTRRSLSRRSAIRRLQPIRGPKVRSAANPVAENRRSHRKNRKNPVKPNRGPMKRNRGPVAPRPAEAAATSPTVGPVVAKAPGRRRRTVARITSVRPKRSARGRGSRSLRLTGTGGVHRRGLVPGRADPDRGPRPRGDLDRRRLPPPAPVGRGSRGPSTLSLIRPRPQRWRLWSVWARRNAARNTQLDRTGPER